MATLHLITVSTAAGFQPPTQKILAGDGVAWHNNDQTSHQPFPTGGKAGDWVPPVTGHNSSEQFNFGTPGTFPYQDADNASLKGTIIVSTGIQIGPIFGQTAAAIVPAAVTIQPGTSIVWQNSDAVPHQPAPVGSPATTWFAHPIAAGAYSSPVAFNEVANINYADALNPSLTGTITVKS